METAPSLSPLRRFPWATGAVALAAILLQLAPPATAERFFYLRPQLLGGEWWRAWSGHLVHFGAGHLAWNLLLFLPIGLWLEWLRPCPTRLFYLTAPALISLALLCGDAGLERYAGLSGLAAGQIAMLALLQCRAGPAGSRPWWLATLALLAAKILWEWRTGAPLLIAGANGLRSVPLAHLAGAVLGSAFGWAAGRSRSN